MAKVTHLTQSTYDHIPIFLEIFKYVPKEACCRFRLKNTWCSEEACKDVIKESWGGSGSLPLMEKLKRCEDDLYIWGRSIWFRLRDEIREAKCLIRRYKGRRDATLIINLCSTEQRLNSLLFQEELYWK